VGGGVIQARCWGRRKGGCGEHGIGEKEKKRGLLGRKEVLKQRERIVKPNRLETAQYKGCRG